jgi:uncharacterized membrane protein
MDLLNRRWLTISLAVVAIAGITTSAMGAQRHVVLCNKSNMNFEVAAAYDLSGTNEITSTGWIKVRSCGCETLFNADVKATEFFYYVTKEGSAVGDALSSGKAPLCVKGDGFTFRSQNKNKAACNNVKGREFHDVRHGCTHCFEDANQILHSITTLFFDGVAWLAVRPNTQLPRNKNDIPHTNCLRILPGVVQFLCSRGINQYPLIVCCARRHRSSLFLR